MSTKYLTGTYANGYSLSPVYQNLYLESTAKVYGTGINVSETQSVSITNLGIVKNTTNGNGISLSQGGTILNGASGNSTATIEGVTAVVVTGGYAVVRNAAVLQSDAVSTVQSDGYSYKNTYSYTGPTVILSSGGSVVNNITASTISNGVLISGGVGNVTNRGSIGGVVSSTDLYNYSGSYKNTEKSGYSIQLKAGGTVTNGSNGTASADIEHGISITGGAGTVTNNGKIEGTYLFYSNYYGVTDKITGPSIVLGSGGTIYNGTGTNTSASIGNGISISGGAGHITNNGSIGGPISFSSYYGHYGQAGNGSGTYKKPSITMNAGGSIINGSTKNSTADISQGVAFSGGRGSIDNFGTIEGSSDTYNTSYYGGGTISLAAIGMKKGGVVTNERGGKISGISISGGVASVVNLGTVDGPSSTTSKYVYNSGYETITTTDYSVVLAKGGSIKNGTSTVVSTLTNGVSISGGVGSLVNYGTIGANSDGVAVSFDRASDTLTEEGTGVLSGLVEGTGSKLILAGDAGAGSIGGLGSTITGFASVTVATGAEWTFTGANTVAKGTTLTDGGELHVAATLTNSGTLAIRDTLDLGTAGRLLNTTSGVVTLGNLSEITQGTRTSFAILNSGLIQKATGSGRATIDDRISNNGTVEAKLGTLELDGNISGTGKLKVDNNATLEIGAVVAASQTVVFSGNANLVLDSSSSFSGALSGFNAGDSLDLSDVASTGARLSYVENAAKTSGILSVTSGGKTTKIDFDGNYAAGSFHLAADGHGGSKVTYGTSAAPSVASDEFTRALFESAFGGTPSAETRFAPLAQTDALPHVTAGLDLAKG